MFTEEIPEDISQSKKHKENMAYQLISSISSHVSLLQSLESFLLTAGWTIMRSGTVNTNQRELIVRTTFSGENFFFGLETTGTDDFSKIFLTAATGYDTSTRASQPNVSGQVRASVKSGGMSRAWFFATNQYCHVFIEVEPGYVQSLFFGCLDRLFSTSTGENVGQYVFGIRDEESFSFWGAYYTQWNFCNSNPTSPHSGLTSGINNVGQAYKGGCVRYKGDTAVFWTNQDGSTPYWTNFYREYGDNLDNNKFRRGLADELVYLKQGTAKPPMMPIMIYVPRNPATSPTHYPLGKMPNLRMIDYEGFTDSQEFTIASDVWAVFRMPNHNAVVTPLSANRQMGFSVRKIL